MYIQRLTLRVIGIITCFCIYMRIYLHLIFIYIYIIFVFIYIIYTLHIYLYTFLLILYYTPSRILATGYKLILLCLIRLNFRASPNSDNP